LPLSPKKPTHPSFRCSLIAALVVGPTCAAEPKETEKPKAPQVKEERIEVTTSAQQDRLSSTDSRQVVTRQDLLKFGATTVAGALARVLGVSVVTAPGPPLSR
jgi:outer membrane receptor for Fe3+-dicitrate